MSAAQLDGALLESQSFDDGVSGESNLLGDREARYEFKRHLIRRLQSMTRGMARSERYQCHQTFIREWRALQDDYEALSHLALITSLLEGPGPLQNADALNAGLTRGVKSVVRAGSPEPAGPVVAGPAWAGPAAELPVQLSVLTS